MNHQRAPEVLDLSRRLEVETPEHVLLQFELAGVGSRTAAAVLDLAILTAIFLSLYIVFSAGGVLGELAASWANALLIALNFLIYWGYFALFEGFASGRTPGKRSLGLRVVMDTGHPVTPAAAIIRNLVRIADMQPGLSYLVGLIFVFFHPEHKRLGDLAAGTIVVRDQPQQEHIPLAAAQESLDEIVLTPQPRLTDDEFRLLEQLIERLDSLDRDARGRLTGQLAQRLSGRFPQRQADTEESLIQLYDEEMARRRSATAIRGGRGSGPVSGTAERFAALRRPVWDRFSHQAERAVRNGLRGQGGGVREFATAYREVAADLARARTYGVDARMLSFLERIVSTGHNALYGAQSVQRRPLDRVLLQELPAAVVRARRYVVAACSLFMVPAVVGFFLVTGDPQGAYELLPPSVIERAELGHQQAEEGRGYGESPSLYLPVVASSIIANNVQVAFMAFAFGVTAGIGTVIVLVFNGLFFGSVLALFANYGLAGWLLTFVAGHGFLELTAIFIAGGAGLLIGRSLVAPGDLARRDSLVLASRTALRLLAAAATLLLLAGAIEGFLSASDAPDTLKLGVSGASVILLLLYFEAGRRAVAVEDADAAN
ncbi:MAG: stage II sporulation protein M [Gemmatimonadales bacterium]|jgi:uncharacterized membrane protein SpoIIM required for sporulation/uncharacterized RDD family membrane protein YckC